MFCLQVILPLHLAIASTGGKLDSERYGVSTVTHFNIHADNDITV